MESQNPKEYKGQTAFESLVINDLKSLKSTLDDHTKQHQDIQQKVAVINVEVDKIKAKSSVWGAVSGAITAIGLFVISTFTGGFGK